MQPVKCAKCRRTKHLLLLGLLAWVLFGAWREDHLSLPHLVMREYEAAYPRVQARLLIFGGPQTLSVDISNTIKEILPPGIKFKDAVSVFQEIFEIKNVTDIYNEKYAPENSIKRDFDVAYCGGKKSHWYEMFPPGYHVCLLGKNDLLLDITATSAAAIYF